MAEHHKTCAHCGVGFVALTARARFCSKKCASMHLYWADPEKIRARRRDLSQKKAGIKPAPNCIQCGMSMKGRRADTKFCSRRCGHRSAQGKSDESYASRQCAECGASIAHKNMNANFCGALCRGRSLRARELNRIKMSKFRAANPEKVRDWKMRWHNDRAASSAHMHALGIITVKGGKLGND